jgi:hypothetical protein
MFQSNERVTVDLSGLVIEGVSFSQNMQKALGTIRQQVSTEPSIYKVELLFSFKGISRPTRVRWRSDRAVCSWELNCSP